MAKKRKMRWDVTPSSERAENRPLRVKMKFVLMANPEFRKKIEVNKKGKGSYTRKKVRNTDFHSIVI